MAPTRPVVSILFAGVMIVGACGAPAQNYPNKATRIITSSVGSSTDTVSRLIARELASAYGQPVIVDNRGGGFIQGEMVSRAPPDGYTVVLAAGGLWLSPLLQTSPYDPIKDFSPISLTTSTPNVLFVHPSVAVTTVKELIAFAKAKPGVLNYASGGTGGTSHLAGELFKSMAGVNIVRISYKTGSQQVADILSGHVQLQFNSLDGYQDHLKSGRLRALAVGSVKPSVLLPDVPAMASTLPGFESAVVIGMFAPAGTPKAVVNRLNQEVARALNKEDVKARILGIAVEPVGSSPDVLAAAVVADMARFGKLIKDAGISAQ